MCLNCLQWLLWQRVWTSEGRRGTAVTDLLCDTAPWWHDLLARLCATAVHPRVPGGSGDGGAGRAVVRGRVRVVDVIHVARQRHHLKHVIVTTQCHELSCMLVTVLTKSLLTNSPQWQSHRNDKVTIMTKSPQWQSHHNDKATVMTKSLLWQSQCNDKVTIMTKSLLWQSQCNDKVTVMTKLV